MEQSMTFFFYMIVFISSAILLWLADRGRVPSQHEKLWQYSGRRGIIINYSAILFTAAFLIVFLVNALRYNVGTDYGNYIFLFNDISAGNMDAMTITWMARSPAYVLLCEGLGALSLDYYWMFAAMGFQFLFFIFLSIKKMSVNWGLSLLLFFTFCLYFSGFNQIREASAIALVAYSIYFLQKNDGKKFILFLLLAASFHASALIFAVAWPVRNLPINKKVFLFYVICGIAGFLLTDLMMPYLEFLDYVAGYSRDVEGAAGKMNFFSICNLLVRFTMFFLCFIFAKRTLKYTPEAKTWYNIAAIATVLQACTLQFNIIGRLTTYFFVVYLFLVPAVMKGLCAKYSAAGKIISYTALYSVMLAYFLVYYFFYGGDGLTNIQTYDSILF